jgi:hypothetical protein
MTFKINLMQVQLQKRFPFLMHSIWKRVSEKTIENCLRKGGFSKTNAETPASEESDLTSEIFDQAPDSMPKEEFENW